MAKSQPEITDRMTNCSVCFEPYEGKGDHVPRLLPCSHTFCERCISDLLEEDVFHCPDCKVPHPAENGAETFKLNKYVLSFMERIAADAMDIKEVTEQLLKKLDLVQDSLNQKRRNIEGLKRQVIDVNKTCGKNLEQKRQYLLNKINETFDEMAKTIDSKTQSETLIIDKDIEQTDNLTKHLQNLKEKIENKTKGEQNGCAVELEQLKNIVEFPIKKYQHCEYHPEDFDSGFFTRICGYLSTEQLEYKGNFSIITGF